MEDAYSACTLCPRMCRVDRRAGRGFCGMGAVCLVARAALHLWEEPCISGTRGSGAVFFSGCNLRCAFCQNRPVSHEGYGLAVTPERLADIFRELVDAGAHNIDLITATPFIPTVLRALDLYTPPVPVVWNSGGYERADVLRLLSGRVQVYLPDLKHVSSRLSGLCAGAPDYFASAAPALLEMRRQTGENVYDENGLLLRGMVVRHLLLPGCTADAIRVMDFVAENLPGVPVSVMRQYTPQPFCTVPGLNRRVTDAEYDRVTAHALGLGLTGYFQEKSSADREYTPPFDGTGVLSPAPIPDRRDAPEPAENGGTHV